MTLHSWSNHLRISDYKTLLSVAGASCLYQWRWSSSHSGGRSAARVLCGAHQEQPLAQRTRSARNIKGQLALAHGHMEERSRQMEREDRLRGPGTCGGFFSYWKWSRTIDVLNQRIFGCDKYLIVTQAEFDFVQVSH